jgi:muramoyltetrapeptide carboxypeptidase LdcA involved in peptidoglycan recycling
MSHAQRRDPSPATNPPLLSLAPGAHVRVVSRAGPARPDQVAACVELLQGFGLRVSLGRAVLGRHGFCSAADQERLADLHAAFADPDVDAVMASRGGYGTQRVTSQTRPSLALFRSCGAQREGNPFSAA